MDKAGEVQTKTNNECGEGCGCDATDRSQGISIRNKWLICAFVFLVAASLTAYRFANRANAEAKASKPRDGACCQETKDKIKCTEE